MQYFIGQVLPYIAVIIFMVGSVIRVAGWFRSPVSYPMTLFPAPRGKWSRASFMAWEAISFRSLYQYDRPLWWLAWMMHFALVVILAGHVVGITFEMEQFTLIGLSSSTSRYLSGILGTTAGIIFLAALIGLLRRRIIDPDIRRLSTMADYGELLLLLTIAASGCLLRLPMAEVDISAVRQYMSALLHLKSATMPANTVFVIHCLSVEVLLIYFPFSKMMHFVGALVTRAILTAPPPAYSAGLRKGDGK